ELRADMTRLLDQWNAIETKAAKVQGPALLYREPELAVRVIREEFNAEYRGVVIDDQRLFEDVRDYVGAFNPELADRVEHFDAVEDGLPLFERFHIHEQLHKALDRKVWLPSGGSLIIEHTEALTVIDVNTGKNVGSTNLEETVFKNNLEAAEEVAKQLRLRDIGGIVVIDFIDMEIKDNRRKVVDAFRSALARDKTRTQVFDISELGLVEMTRKRTRENLVRSLSQPCPYCEGKGYVKSRAAICAEIIRALKRAIRRRKPESIDLVVHPDIADLLLEEEQTGVEELEADTGVRIAIKDKPSLHIEQFEIQTP
ncbi:ribonuclease E/G, partial [bacterium]|nr:ribonuclease E/G [bacterium]